MSSDFRGPGGDDDALPGPPQLLQALPGAPPAKTSEDSEGPAAADLEKADGPDAAAADDKSEDGDAADTTAPAPAPAASGPNPADAALLKQVNSVLSSEVMRLLCQDNHETMLTPPRLVSPRSSTVSSRALPRPRYAA